MLPDTAGANWSPSGSYRAAAVTAANLAITAIRQSSRYKLGKVYFIWAQGEQDAQTMNGTTINGPLYEQALEDLAAYFKAQVPEMEAMGVVMTGAEVDVTDDNDYADIHTAQEAACADSANLVMVYRGAFSFIVRSLMSDNIHYSQAGYNMMGKCAARALARGGAFTPSAPQVLATENFEDTSYTATTSRTVSHTTAAGTKTLVVALGWMRPDSSTAVTVDGVTYNGVAMTKVVEKSSSDGVLSPGMLVNSSIWMLTETAYGSGLSAVTANIVASDNVAGSIIDICAIDLDVIAMQECAYSYNPSPAATNTTTLTVNTTAPTVLLTVGTAGIVDASVKSATLTNSTEIMDHSLMNLGPTRSGNFVVGYTEEASAVDQKAITATWTAAANTMAVITMGFREIIDGE